MAGRLDAVVDGSLDAPPRSRNPYGLMTIVPRASEGSASSASADDVLVPAGEILVLGAVTLLRSAVGIAMPGG